MSGAGGPAERVRGDRGQFVLLAGVVVALALVAMLTAYLQLGYHADVSTGEVDRTVADGRSFLERATHHAARPLRGEYAWGERRSAVTALRDRLEPRLDTLERARVTEGAVVRATVNETVAARWASANCPRGPDREFGPCESDRGVVVQERAGRTLALAVGYDLNVTTDEGTTRLTLVVETVQ